MSRTTEYAKLGGYNLKKSGTVESHVNHTNCQMNNLKQVAGKPAASVPGKCGVNPSPSLCPGGQCDYMATQQPLYPLVNHGYNALTFQSDGAPYYQVSNGPYAQPCSQNMHRNCHGGDPILRPGFGPFPVMPRSRPRPRPRPGPIPNPYATSPPACCGDATISGCGTTPCSGDGDCPDGLSCWANPSEGCCPNGGGDGACKYASSKDCDITKEPGIDGFNIKPDSGCDDYMSCCGDKDLAMQCTTVTDPGQWSKHPEMQYVCGRGSFASQK